MVEVLLVSNGILFGLFISLIVYFKYILQAKLKLQLDQFNELIDKQKSDMEKFTELHKRAIARDDKIVEEMAKITVDINNLKSKPIVNRFGVHK